MIPDVTIDDVTCLGCGCACDDIRIIVRSGRIADTPNACWLGQQWLGDGGVSSTIRVDGRDVSLDEAVDAVVARLEASTSPLVYLAPGISIESQRAAAAIADLLHGRLDSVTSATALPFIVAAQERGFASATFGEIRNRADVVVYWAVDIAGRYPRFVSRYASSSADSLTRLGIAVDVGGARSTIDSVGRRVSISPADELATVSALSALVRDPVSLTHVPDDVEANHAWSTARELAALLLAGHYTAIVVDAEPDDRAARSSQRFDALLSLSHALNDRTRCALITLRGNGNRSGADIVLTSQTGFPAAVDFSRGYPRYEPHTASAALADADVALVVGDASELPDHLIESHATAHTIVIGPHASASPLGSTGITIDTGTAGIHTAGTAYRADEVPLPLRAAVTAGLSATDVVAAIARRLTSARRQTRAEGAVR